MHEVKSYYDIYWCILLCLYTRNTQASLSRVMMLESDFTKVLEVFIAELW